MNTLTSSNKSSSSNIYSSMRMSVLLKIARKNLFSRKLRTILTIMGVVIGVSAVVFLVSFGVGLQKLVEKQVIGSKSIKTIDVNAAESRLLKFDDTSINKIAGIAGVSKVGKVYTIAGKIKTNESESSSVVYGANQAYLELSSFNIVSGSMISTSDTSAAMVNSSLLKVQGITDNDKAIGQDISITFIVPAKGTVAEHTATVNLSIGGVVESGSGSEVFIPSSVIEAKGIANASQLKVLAEDRDSVAKIRSDIESRGYTTTSPLDTISEIDRIFQLIQLILIGFSSIGMIIAILGMFNTLTITLLERTREIGLMVTLGAQQKDIKRLFIAEALMLSVIGGAFGIVTAFIFGKIGDLILNMKAHSNGITDNLTAFYISPLLVICTVAVVIVIGLLVVFFPARRASRISPLDAMRE